MYADVTVYVGKQSKGLEKRDLKKNLMQEDLIYFIECFVFKIG